MGFRSYSSSLSSSRLILCAILCNIHCSFRIHASLVAIMLRLRLCSVPLLGRGRGFARPQRLGVDVNLPAPESDMLRGHGPRSAEDGREVDGEVNEPHGGWVTSIVRPRRIEVVVFGIKDTGVVGYSI